MEINFKYDQTLIDRCAIYGLPQLNSELSKLLQDFQTTIALCGVHRRYSELSKFLQDFQSTIYAL